MTSVKVLVLSLILYFEELFWNAVLATTSCEPGTRRYPSGPGCGEPRRQCRFSQGQGQLTVSTISRNQTSTEQDSMCSCPAEW